MHPDELAGRIASLQPHVLVATTQVGDAFPPYLAQDTGHPLRVILLAEELDDSYEAALLRHGAARVLPLYVAATDLIRVVHEVLYAGTSLSDEAAPDRGVPFFTPRR